MPKKILAVDDERPIVGLIQVNLERAGYTVVTAFNGKEALEQVEAEHPDLVVLDVMMPGMDGFEVLQNLRKNPNIGYLPVIMLMDKAQDADALRYWQGGYDCYLTKPVKPLEIIAFAKRIFKALEEYDDDDKREMSPGLQILRKLLFIPAPKIMRDQVRSLAIEECHRRGWKMLNPIEVEEDLKVWIVGINTDSYDASTYLYVDNQNGSIKIFGPHGRVDK